MRRGYICKIQIRAINVNKYLLHSLGALLFCSFFIGVRYLSGDIINFYWLVFSFMFGLVFVPLVVIKLPIFSSYYSYSYDRKHHDYANRKAAPAMAALVTGIVLAIILYFIGIENIKLPIFCGAISASIISLYYERF